MMNRRQFLLNVFKISGLVGLYSIGVSRSEAQMLQAIVAGGKCSGWNCELYNDPNCVAVWRFESSPGFTADSKGTNTLTNSGADVETTTVLEGSQSAKFVRANSDFMMIADADQDVGFPLRYADGGASEKSYSLFFRVYFTSLGTTIYILNRFTGSAGAFVINVDSPSHKLQFVSVRSGPNFETAQFSTAFQTNNKYSVGITFDATSRAYRLRVYDHVAGDLLGADRTGNFNYDQDFADTQFDIGSFVGFNFFLGGYLDEVAVFNRVLSVAEIDAIRAGTFGQ